MGADADDTPVVVPVASASPVDQTADPGRTRQQRTLDAVFHVAIALAFTAPLAWRSDRLPLGTEPVGTVPRFNLWTLRWTADRIPHGLSGWWDAPIFWPKGGAFAWSEPQPLTGLAFALISPLTGDVRGYAAIVIVTIALNGIAAAALARQLGAGRVPALLTGLLAQALPFVFDQLGVLQLIAVWPLFATITCALQWLEPEAEARRSVLARSALLGLAFAAAIGTCGYYALLLALCLAVALPLAARRTWVDEWRQRVGGLVVAGATAGVLAGPFVLGQGANLGNRRWRDSTILAGSAHLDDWLSSGRCWPGVGLIIVAISGAVLGRSHRATRLLVTVGLVGLIASFGAVLSIGGFHPWVFLTDHFDAVARLRSPYRAAAIVQVAMVGLSAFALERLWALRQTAARATAVAIVAVAVLSTGIGPGRLVDDAPPAGAWAQWLSDHPDHGAVAFLPFAPSGRVADFEPTTVRMLQTLGTGHPMINGYSGFFPSDHAATAATMAGFPNQGSLDLLHRLKVRYVVIATEYVDPFTRRLWTRLGYRVLVKDADAYLLAVPR